MAVMIGSGSSIPRDERFVEHPLKWLAQQVQSLLQSGRYNPSPFPDRVWSRHSALLDAATHRSQRQSH